jgi:membrane associated rhomboid family serine protease
MGEMDRSPALPPPPTSESCYRHPAIQTMVHCTRCGRPICPDCMIKASVGHHCPKCVAEARAEYRRGPGRRIAIADVKGTSATRVLLTIIVAVYVLEVINGGAASVMGGPSVDVLFKLGGSFGYAIADGQYWRLFTAMFLHASLIHLAFNSYALWIFGSMVEPQVGRWRFLAIYLLTGLAAGASSYAFLYPRIVGIGASGAVFGIFGVFLVYNYKRRYTALGAARLRSGLVMLALNAFLGFSIPGIDWRAHLGGLIAGSVAGLALEAKGSERFRSLVFIGSLAAIALVTVGLVVWRTGYLQQHPFL